MKRTLLFIVVVIPVALVVSPILSIALAFIVFFRSMADYWESIVRGWFDLHKLEQTPTKEETVWQKHQRKMDERLNANKDELNNN